MCAGPVGTEFQEVSEPAFTDRMPKALWVSAERVAADALRAADAGRRIVVPGGPHVRAAFAPNRVTPAPVALAVSRVLFSRELQRD